MTASN